MERVSRCSMSEGKRRVAELLCASAYCRSIRRRRIDRARCPLPSRKQSGRFHRRPRGVDRCRLRSGHLPSTGGSRPALLYTLRWLVP
eukprot:1285486-Pleurochrysis_carterae.AAC.1